MQAFIKKEAEEKAKEIRLKLQEEYEIEKSLVVRTETNAIDSVYEQKLKKASLTQQITKSKIDNKTRLRVLGTKAKILSQIFQETGDELKELTKDAGKYKTVLIGLIEEGLLTLLESKISVRAREVDIALVKESIEEAAAKFETKAGFPVEVTVDEETFLSKDGSGGVILINGTGKIEVNNTLDERLTILSEEALPAIRLELFGISTTRKFFD